MRTLVNANEITVGMVLTGIQLSSGQVARFGRYRVESLEEWDASKGQRVQCIYLHNNSLVRFEPCQECRYEVECNSDGRALRASDFSRLRDYERNRRSGSAEVAE